MNKSSYSSRNAQGAADQQTQLQTSCSSVAANLATNQMSETINL